jgi:hypothetical protein
MLHRYVGTPVLSAVIRRTAPGLRLADSQSGFRAFTAAAAQKLDLRSNGMEFASEMLIRAAQQQLRVVEVPVNYRARIGESKLNTFADGWRHLRLILLSAPGFFIFWSGLVGLIAGCGLTLWTLFQPAGITVGSLRWQPIFLSSIFLVLGSQAVLVGMVLGYRATRSAGEKAHFRWVASPTFRLVCALLGLVALTLGALLDGALLIQQLTGGAGSSLRLALAATAQSLLLVGGTLLSLAYVRLRRSREIGEPSAGGLRAGGAFGRPKVRRGWLACCSAGHEARQECREADEP